MAETNTQLKSLTPAQYAFIRWLSARHPNLLAQAEERRAALDGFMDSLTSVFDRITKDAPDLLKQYVTSKTELEQLKMNIDRARAGQPPIELPIAATATNAVNSIPGWAWGAIGAITLYLLTRK